MSSHISYQALRSLLFKENKPESFIVEERKWSKLRGKYLDFRLFGYSNWLIKDYRATIFNNVRKRTICPFKFRTQVNKNCTEAIRPPAASANS